MDEEARSVTQVETVCAKDGSVIDQQAGYVEGGQDRDGETGGVLAKHSLHLPARVITGKSSSPVGVRAEATLCDPAIALAIELHAITLEVVDALRGVAGYQLYGSRIGQQAALQQ